jgi:hypothetical protein
MATFQEHATVTDAAKLPKEKRCYLGCHGVQLTPPSGIYTPDSLARACIEIQKALLGPGRPVVHVHVRASLSETAGSFRELGCPVMWGDQLGWSEMPPGPAEPSTVMVSFGEATVCFFAPARPSSKEDCWLLARYRRLPYSGPALWKKPLGELQSLLGLINAARPIRSLEEAFLSHEQAARSEFIRTNLWSVAELKKRLSAEGLSSSVGMPRGGMVDALRTCPTYGKTCNLASAGIADDRLPGLAELDEHQQKAVHMGLRILARDPSLQELLISAGPGAGKTTTITNFLAHAVTTMPTTRILVLVFNVEAESTLRKRLTRLLPGTGGIIPKTKVADPGYQGCAILTFDKMAYQICQNARSQEQLAHPSQPSDELAALLGHRTTIPVAGPQNYRDGKEQAARLLDPSEGKHAGGIAEWDLIVVDEGQDVTSLEANIVEGLLCGRRPATSIRPGLIVAGDPRQEVYSGATWYSGRWFASQAAQVSGMPGMPGVSATILYNNYRSAPEIVEALNAFSREAFPTLHHDQVAVRVTSSSEVHPIQIVEVPWAGSPGETNVAIGQQVGSFMAKRKPGESYGLVPVTLEKFKTDAATSAARQTLHEHRPAEYTLALTGPSKIPEGDVYILSTARRIKGTERKLVVVYAADRDYDIVVDNASLTKLLYVALSRARDELVLVTQKLDTQRIKNLMAPFVHTVCAQQGGHGAGVVTASPVEAPRRLKLTPVPITGEALPNGAAGMGICQVPYGSAKPWESEVIQISALPVIGSTQVQLSQADFIGKLAEAHLALGIHTAWKEMTARSVDISTSPLANPKNLEITVDAQRINHGLYTRFTGCPPTLKYVLCTSAGNRDQLERLLTAARSALQGDEECERCAPYIHAMLAFTALCGRPWTVSSVLTDPDLTTAVARESVAIGGHLLTLAASALNVDVGDLDEPRFWVRGGMKLGACRPGDPLRPSDHHPAFSDAEVSYETDVLLSGKGRLLPVELKHTASLTPEHERQLFSYMALLTPLGLASVGQPATPARGFLYNGKSGELRMFQVARSCPQQGVDSFAEFTCRARTLLAIRTARSAILLHLAPHAITPPEMLSRVAAGHAHTTAISVDAEHDDKGNLTEIGAVAVSLTDWSILGTFQRRAPSMIPIGPPGSTAGGRGGSAAWIEDIVRLRRDWGRTPRAARKNLATSEGEALHADFLHWCGEMTTSKPVFLHWGGSEKTLLGADALTVDVYSSCFIPWLELKGSPRRGDTKLACALQQLLPQLPFAAHQAFEDALACLAVLLATADFGGKL